MITRRSLFGLFAGLPFVGHAASAAATIPVVDTSAAQIAGSGFLAEQAEIMGVGWEEVLAQRERELLTARSFGVSVEQFHRDLMNPVLSLYREPGDV